MMQNEDITLPEFTLELFSDDIPVLFFPFWCIVYLVSLLLYWLSVFCTFTLNRFNRLKKGKSPQPQKEKRKLRQ